MLNREDFILGFVSEARDTIDSAEECLLEMEKYNRTITESKDAIVR